MIRSNLSIDFPDVFWGPNPFSSDPAVVFRLNFSAALPPGEVDAAWDAARRLWPRLATREARRWTAEAGEPPLAAFCRLVALIALGVQNMRHGLLTEARAVSLNDGQTLGVVGHYSPAFARKAVALACNLLLKASNPDLGSELASRLGAEIDAMMLAAKDYGPDSHTRVLMVAARDSGLPIVRAFDGGQIYQYGWGCRGALFADTGSVADSYIGDQICGNKIRARHFVANLGLPVPAQRTAVTVEDAVAAAGHLGYPCVVKPADLYLGLGVTAGIASADEVREAFPKARRLSRYPVVVESFVPGTDHRIFVVGKRFRAAVAREHAHVVGDGASTIRSLITAENRRRTEDHRLSLALSVIEIDTDLLDTLARRNLDPDTVPAAGQRVVLRTIANIHSGGLPRDVTDRVHPDTRRMAEQIAETLNICSLGIDFITTDISRSWREGFGSIIEINLPTGVDVILGTGKEEAEIGGWFLSEPVGRHSPGRIPSLLVVGTAEESREVLRPVERHLTASGLTVGTASPTGARLGDLGMLPKPTLPGNVTSLLLNRCCEAILVGGDAASLRRHGLPLDRFDAAVILPSARLHPGMRATIQAHCAALFEPADGERPATATLLDRLRLDLVRDPGPRPRDSMD